MDPVFNNVIAQWGAVGILVALLILCCRALWQRVNELTADKDKLNEKMQDRLIVSIENNTRILTELAGRITAK